MQVAEIDWFYFILQPKVGLTKRKNFQANVDVGVSEVSTGCLRKLETQLTGFKGVADVAVRVLTKMWNWLMTSC